MPRALLLISTRTYRARDFLAAARGMGLDVVIATDKPQALSVDAPNTNLTLDFEDLDGCVIAARALDQRLGIDAVVGPDDESARAAAAIGKALGTPHNPLEAMAFVANKHALRSRMREVGLPCPHFELFPVEGDARAGALRVNYPCVLKPTFLSASRGVLRANDPNEFVHARDRIARLLAKPSIKRQGKEQARWILVEDYLAGSELAVEGLLQEGVCKVLAIFEKPDPLEGPTFEETIYLTPPRIRPELIRKIETCVRDVVSATGLREGPVHAEVRCTPTAVHLLEIAPRAIGGLCPRVLRFRDGVSLEELILRHAAGLEVASIEREAKAAGVMMIPTPAAGKLIAIDGITDAESVVAIDEITFSAHLGEQLVPLPEGNRYVGFIFARADSADEVESALRSAHAALDLVIDSEG